MITGFNAIKIVFPLLVLQGTRGVFYTMSDGSE